MQYAIDDEFKALIGQERLQSLNKHEGTVYGLDDAFRIVYLNPAWFRFSKANGGGHFSEMDWTLGANVFDCIPDVLRPFYKQLYRSALLEGGASITTPQIEYECSSPTVFRSFAMHVYPVNSNAILVVHSLKVEEPLTSHADDQAFPLEEGLYVDASGIIHQCANCRRLKNLNHADRWDWVPKSIEAPIPSISHGICEPCAAHFYLSSDKLQGEKKTMN